MPKAKDTPEQTPDDDAAVVAALELVTVVWLGPEPCFVPSQGIVAPGELIHDVHPTQLAETPAMRAATAADLKTPTPTA